MNRDIQNEADDRGIPILRVGICDLKMPLRVGGVERDPLASQGVTAVCSLAVDLAAELRGIHMSRLVEDLLASAPVLDLSAMRDLLQRLRERQGATQSVLTFDFDYFLDRRAPVSGLVAKQAYRCRLEARLAAETLDFRQGVEVPVTTLCPCSKEISAYGAHNQRGYVTVELEHRFAGKAPAVPPVCLEEIIGWVETAASAPLYPILKRTDERYVTMQAFDQPRFVEDMVRGVAQRLGGDPRLGVWRVRVTNHESIHQHNAYAVIEGNGAAP